MVVSLSFRGSVVQIGDHLFWVSNYHSITFHIDEYLKISMPPSKRRALASRSKRKRKFFGVCNQDILSASDGSDCRPSNSESSRPATGVIVEPNLTSTPKRSRISKNDEKLQSSLFETSVDNEGILTRSCRRRMGLSKFKHVEKADDGYPMIDLTLLQEAFQSPAICHSCKRSDSKLSILRDCRRRHGLAERVIIKCSACSKETIFNTSREIQKGNLKSTQDLFLHLIP